MLLRLKITTVQPVALLLGHDHGGTAFPRQFAGAFPQGGRASTRTKRLRGVAVAMALKEEEPESSRSRFAGGGLSWDPRMEIGVPYEQRPVNEYSALKESTLYSWAELSPGSFFMRLGSLCLVTFTVLAAPISAASFSPGKDPLKFVLAAGIGTLLLVSLVVLRIYLGWSYVGDRLLSAVVPYEETGWYDGQMWVKPAEVLARDRLLGSYKVKPVINLLKQTLVGTGALLVGAVVLFAFAVPVEEFVHSFNGAPSTASSKPIMRREELLKLPAEVRQDDDLAAAAAEAANGRPVYCRDRYYRALAGGQYCTSDDLLD
ncbi:hypothetical protein ZWY2020_010983 [Hordeum vulgare]|nr:hypothetical protein ZWY2020_010983 [Hordeum vulgare]